MAEPIVSINFYGHDSPEVAGTDASFVPLTRQAPKTVSRQLKRSWTLHVVGKERLLGCESRGREKAFYDYNAALNEESNKALAETILKLIMDSKTSSGDFSPANLTGLFLITGYSSGGPSALHMARLLTKRAKVCYVGLADAEFERGNTDYLMRKNDVTGKYLKNYYQTKGNGSDNPFIHDAIDGFTNFKLDGEIKDEGDSEEAASHYHDAAVKIANERLFNDLKWCMENC